MKKRLRKPYVVSQAFLGVQTFMRVVDGCLTTEQPTRYPLLVQLQDVVTAPMMTEGQSEKKGSEIIFSDPLIL